MPSAGEVKVEPANVLVESEQAEPSIHKEYHDLAEVFSEQELDLLPLHHPTDSATEILPGAKLPKPKMYSMTPKGDGGTQGFHG